jgi:hypothetical protein
MYIRPGEITTDKRFTDMGRFTLALEGQPTADVLVGELWVTYHVRFSAPRIEPHGYSTASWCRLNGGAYDNNDVMGSVVVTAEGPLPCYIGSAGSYWDRIYFPPLLDYGYYLLVSQWTGDSTASLGISANVTNCSKTQCWELDTQSMLSSNGTSTHNVYLAVVQVTSPGAYITFSSATLPANGVSNTHYIAQIGDPLTEVATPLAYLEALNMRGVPIIHPSPEHNLLKYNFADTHRRDFGDRQYDPHFYDEEKDGYVGL